jgi:hypothetical protein
MSIVSVVWRFRAWICLALLISSVALLVHQHRSHSTELAIASRELEEVTLRSKGQIVAIESTSREIERARDEALADGHAVSQRNTELERALAEALRVSPGARVVSVTRASTEPAQTRGEPTPALPACPSCLVADTDRLVAHVDEVRLRTSAGSEIVTGTVAVERLGERPTLLLREPWSSQITAVARSIPSVIAPVAPLALRPSWGLGVIGTLSTRGWSAGVLVASPRVWRLEGSVGGAYGPGGFVGVGGIVFR